MARIIFATLGSSGDVRPMLAVASVASRHGHDISMATTRGYQPLIEAHDVSYLEFGNDAFFADAETRSAVLDRKSGYSLWFNLFNLDRLEDMYAELHDYCQGADVLVSYPGVMTPHLVAEKLRIPLLNLCFSPAAYLPDQGAGRASDPDAVNWIRRLNALRQKLELPRMTFPQMGRFDANLTLGLYPDCLRDTGRTTIRSIVHVGYPLLKNDHHVLGDDLKAWACRGAFCLFTFGSHVDHNFHIFFKAATNACKSLNIRCLYVTPYNYNSISCSTEDVRVEAHIDHNAIMSLASIIVHHGGTGTLSEALLHNRPTVVVPFGLDQYYNADRLDKCDLAEVLPFEAVDSGTLEAAIARAMAEAPRRAKKFEGEDFSIGGTAAVTAYNHIARYIGAT